MKKVSLLLALATLVLAFAVGHTSLTAAPDRKPTYTPPRCVAPGPVPHVAMMSWQYGLVTQNGRAVVVEGNAAWYAVGRIRDDGTIELMWINRDDGTRAAGLYRLVVDDEGVRMEGSWTREPLDNDGRLRGAPMGDRITATAGP